MRHLAAGAGLGLAVEVQAFVGLGRELAPVLDLVAQQIGHFDAGVGRRGAKRPAGDGADMLFELVADAAVLGPVAGVVDARGDLVDQKHVVSEVEQFDAQNADVIQPIHDRLGDGAGADLRLLVHGGGGQGGAQDAAFVPVLAQRIDRHMAVPVAGGDNRQFAHEGRLGLQNGRTTPQAFQGGGRVLDGVDPDLTLAVIAFAAGLQEGGQPQFG